MYKTMKEALISWNEETTDRQKIQHTYLVTVAILLVLAGLVGLVNYQLSQSILAVVFAGAALYIINVIVWALLQSLILLPLQNRRTPVPKSETKRSTRR